MSEQTANSLPAVVSVDKEKCTHCHLCIGVCPVKYCNDASDITAGITVNSDLCIGCGACIKVCSHEARLIVDDTERFFNDLAKGEKILALMAPAVDVNFPGQIEHLMGWLKSVGVSGNFDVSFGAEITTFQYLKALRAGVKTPVIAQPCPSVVSYIEIYRPSLMAHLAPTGSPAMDMAVWVTSTHPGMKLAFISPCIAKKREFDDPNTMGRIQYNVTIANLKKYIAKNGIQLDKFPALPFDGPMEAERALLFSQPGGLYETVKRYKVRVKSHQIRRTEGIEIYHEYFDELEREIKDKKCDVILVDILNCQHGCNRGTGTVYNEHTTDEVLRYQDERLENRQKTVFPTEAEFAELQKKLEELDNLDYSRKYTDRSETFNKLETPDEEGIKALHVEMGKHEPKDIKNCGACGYMSCNAMAKAIMNGLYRPQQCHHFLEDYYREHSKDTE
jgi:iron only hydrogenase large subunit-like protein